MSQKPSEKKQNININNEDNDWLYGVGVIGLGIYLYKRFKNNKKTKQ